MTPADWTSLREAEQDAKDRRDAARSRQARANQHAEAHRALVLGRQMAIENAPADLAASSGQVHPEVRAGDRP